jgi:hypothetical protein
MFDQGNINGLVLSTRPGEYSKLNIEVESEIEDWMNWASLDKVEHLNKETEVIADLGFRAKAIIYLDTKSAQNRVGSTLAR